MAIDEIDAAVQVAASRLTEKTTLKSTEYGVYRAGTSLATDWLEQNYKALLKRYQLTWT